MMLVLPLLLVAAPWHGSDGDASPAEGPNVLSIYDLASVLPRFDAETKWTERLVVSSADTYNGALPQVSGSIPHQDGSPEVVVELLTQLIGDDLRFEGRRVGLEEASRFAVLAPEEVHARVREALAFLQERLTAGIELSVDVLTAQGASPSGGLPGGLVDAAEAERLINGYAGRGAVHRRFAVRLGAGRTSSLDEVRRTSFVWDYDVEIAQGALVFDPIIGEAEQGLRLLARGVPVEGGVFLSLLFRDSQLVGEIGDKTMELRGAVGKEDGGLKPVNGPELLQTADVVFRSTAFDTFLPDGQALVVGSETDVPGAQTSQILVLRRTGGDLVSSASRSFGGPTSLVLLDTELLSPPRFDVGPSPWVDAPNMHPSLVATLVSEPSLFLFDWMKNRFSSWRRLGPWAIAVTSPDWDPGSAADLQGLIAGIRHRTEVTTVELTLASRSGRVPARMCLPVRRGTSADGACGVSTHAIVDYDVEVAQFAEVGDPVRPALLDGLSFAFRSAGAKDGLDLELRAFADRRVQPVKTVDLGDLYTQGELEQVDLSGLRLDERVSLAAGGAPVILGDAGEKDGPAALRLELRAR